MAQRTTKATSTSSNSVENIVGIKRLTDSSDYDGETIPTGILSLDAALGGGIARGKIAEAFGPEASGKSAIAMMLSGQAQAYGKVVYMDIENTLDPRLLENSGVDLSELLLLQPDTAEDAFDRLHELAVVDDVSLVVIDSVAAMVPSAEMEGDMQDKHMMLMGRIMSAGLRKLNALSKRNENAPIFFFVNQIREKNNPTGRGAPTQSTGGRALRFYSSVRMDVRYIEKETQGTGDNNVIGHKVKVNVVKNKYAAPFQVANFKIIYATGISNESTIIEEAVNSGFLQKSGSWYKYPGSEKNIANGEAAMRQYLMDNPEERDALRDKIVANL